MNLHSHVTGSSSVPQSDDASDADAGVRQTEVPAGWWGESLEYLFGLLFYKYELFWLNILLVLSTWVRTVLTDSPRAATLRPLVADQSKSLNAYRVILAPLRYNCF